MEAALVLTSAFSPQLIQTISVVDRDEPQSGHRFYFTLAPEATNNHHFSLLDIQGKSCCTLGPASFRLSSSSGHERDVGHCLSVPALGASGMLQSFLST